MDRIEQVRAVAEEYGKRSVENMKLGGKLGREIMRSFDKYLSSEGGLVFGVPPSGEWNSDSDYGDAAFSYYHQGVLRVRDTEFGMCVTVFKDVLWIRIVVKLEKQGDRIGVFVDDGEPTWIPISYGAADLERICERLLSTLIGYYQGDTNKFVYGDEKHITIGFRSRTQEAPA